MLKTSKLNRQEQTTLTLISKATKNMKDKKVNRRMSFKATLWPSGGLVLLLATIVQVRAAGEIQPPNQQAGSSSLGNQSGEVAAGAAPAAAAAASQTFGTPQAEFKLPKINVYVKRSEIKKLLGK